MKLEVMKVFAEKNDLYARESIGSGAYGTYYKISDKVGIKIYQSVISPTPRGVMFTPDWRKAKRALKFMNRVSRHKLAPKGYAVMAVKFGDHYRVGLFMEHIKGRHAEMSQRQYDIIAAKLKRLGIYHNDLGSHNFMRSGKRPVVIDWDFAAARNRRPPE